MLVWYLWYVEGVDVQLVRGLNERYPIFFAYAKLELLTMPLSAIINRYEAILISLSLKE